ncbi:hypothetical protein R1sor_013183 [Riccia sorocarpa]|uniref:Uncharacterized protein n=1 Tax=Riccia sorocarpa TaxID=122646 RepID=A0ABD3H9R0_9MARC
MRSGGGSLMRTRSATGSRSDGLKETSSPGPSTEATRRKKALETPEQALGAGPSEPPISRPKKGAKRGVPKKLVDPNAIEGQYLVEFEVIPDPDRHIRWGYVNQSGRDSTFEVVRMRDLMAFGLGLALELSIHRPHEWAPALECISMMLLASRRPRTIPGRLVYYIKHFLLDPQDEPEQHLDFMDLMAHSLRHEMFAVQAHLREDKPERYMETFVAIPDMFTYLDYKSDTVMYLDYKGDTVTYLDYNSDMYPYLGYNSDTCTYLGYNNDTYPYLGYNSDTYTIRARAGLRPMVISPSEPRMKFFIFEPQGFFFRLANVVGVGTTKAKGFDVLSVVGKSLVVRPGDCLVGFLEGFQKRCRIIVWSRQSKEALMSFLEEMVMKGYLPAFLLDTQACTVWGGDRVEVVHPRNNPDKHVKLKSFRRLHNHGICLRDVLIVDTSPKRNSRNHPYSGMHPRAMDGFPSVPKMSAWLARFTDLLTIWTENVLPTIDFVRAHRRSMDGILDPILVLREVWEKTPQPVDRYIIGSDVPSATRGDLLVEWPHFFVHAEALANEKTPVEGAPAEKTTRVEEATLVEGAPAEKTTRVEEATRIEKAPVEEVTHVEEIPLAIPIPVEAIPLGATQE